MNDRTMNFQGDPLNRAVPGVGITRITHSMVYTLAKCRVQNLDLGCHGCASTWKACIMSVESKSGTENQQIVTVMALFL